MTVATRSSQRAVEVAPASPLVEASFTVDEHPERFIALMRAASGEELKPVAPRLLELLRSKTFGLQRLDDATPREVAVQAVLRAGYPWALELEPEDVAFVREQEASAASARRRSLLRRSIPFVLVLVGLAFAVNGFVRIFEARRSENPVTPVQRRSVTLYPPRAPVAPKPLESLALPDFRVATAEELVPEVDRVPLLEATIDRLVASGREVEALSVGVDCLSLPASDERGCALAAGRAIAAIARPDSRDVPKRADEASGAVSSPTVSEAARARARARELLEGLSSEPVPAGTTRPRTAEFAVARASHLSDQLFLFSEAPLAPSVRSETRQMMGTLRQLAQDDVVWVGRSESSVREAKAHFARGEFTAALKVADDCVASFPLDPECLSVAATALALVHAVRPSGERIAHEAAVAEQFDMYRRQLARVLARNARQRCGAQPGTDESRPIACP